MKSSSETADTAIVEYQKLQPLYQRVVEEVIFVLKETSNDSDVKVISIHGRTKEPDSLREKIGRKEYVDPLREMTDLAGVRVVCNYESDLAWIEGFIRKKFEVHDRIDKSRSLGVDRMGYHGVHYVVSLGENYADTRYEGISNLRCEIQVRTVLQDAWALISHHLVYKDEASIPERFRRDLNNVASLLEIAQGVFDTVRENRVRYLADIREKEEDVKAFLAQPLDYDTLLAYTEWKFPSLGVSQRWHTRLLADLNHEKYRSLEDIDRVILQAKQAIDAYQRENPGWFRTGTAYITKSLGFMDPEFRRKHPWGQQTIDAFKKFGHLAK